MVRRVHGSTLFCDLQMCVRSNLPVSRRYMQNCSSSHPDCTKRPGEQRETLPDVALVT